VLKQLPVEDIEVRIAIQEGDRELPDDQVYNVAIYFVVDQLVWDGNPDVREVVSKAFGTFASLLSECTNVAVDQELSGVRSGDDFSWQMTRRTDEWNFANLSQQD